MLSMLSSFEECPTLGSDQTHMTRLRIVGFGISQSPGSFRVTSLGLGKFRDVRPGQRPESFHAKSFKSSGKPIRQMQRETTETAESAESATEGSSAGCRFYRVCLVVHTAWSTRCEALAVFSSMGFRDISDTLSDWMRLLCFSMSPLQFFIHGQQTKAGKRSVSRG